MRRFSLAALLVPVLVAGGTVSAQETHPFSIHDMLAMDRLSDPQMSPDGSAVAFTVRTTDLAANRGRTDVWIAHLDDSEPRRLTTNEAADFHPRWAPDGEALFFLSTRSGSSQVWRLPVSGASSARVPLTANTSSQPSASKSKKATPEPMASKM